MQEFLEKAEEDAANLMHQLEQMNEKFNELAEYFVLDKEKASVEEFFRDLLTFLKDFEASSSSCKHARLKTYTHILTYIHTYIHTHMKQDALLDTMQVARKDNQKKRKQLERQKKLEEQKVCEADMVHAQNLYKLCYSDSEEALPEGVKNGQSCSIQEDEHGR